MIDIHAHEVLHMMEGNNYADNEALRSAVVERFGAEQTFNTCSREGLDIDSLILFLKEKGKFKPSCGGFTMDITKVCNDY